MIRLNTRQKMAIARTAQRGVSVARKLMGLPGRGVFIRGGLLWDLDLAEGIDFSIFLLGAFEPDVVNCCRKLIREGDVVLDIGANIGAHTLHMAREVGARGHVFAFEPTVYAFAKLKRHLELNGELASRVTATQMLLTESSTTKVPAAICSSWPLAHEEGLHETHLGKAHSTDGAVAATLDSFLEERGVARVAFVKLDVDGHELEVLQGAAVTLKKHRPVILIELCPHVCAEHGYSFEQLISAVTGAGYVFETPHGHPLPSDALSLEKLIPQDGGINVLAKPK